MKQEVSHYHSHQSLLDVFISFKISSKDVLHNISSFIQYGIEYSNKTNDFKVRNPMVIRVDK